MEPPALHRVGRFLRSDYSLAAGWRVELLDGTEAVTYFTLFLVGAGEKHTAAGTFNL